jgi:hypothetical protein
MQVWVKMQVFSEIPNLFSMLGCEQWDASDRGIDMDT